MKRKRQIEGKTCDCGRSADRVQGSSYVCEKCAAIESELNRFTLGFAIKRRARRLVTEKWTIKHFDAAFKRYCERTGMVYHNETWSIGNER